MEPQTMWELEEIRKDYPRAVWRKWSPDVIYFEILDTTSPTTCFQWVLWATQVVVMRYENPKMWWFPWNHIIVSAVTLRHLSDILDRPWQCITFLQLSTLHISSLNPPLLILVCSFCMFSSKGQEKYIHCAILNTPTVPHIQSPPFYRWGKQGL